jgi:hypothetical protein
MDRVGEPATDFGNTPTGDPHGSEPTGIEPAASGSGGDRGPAPPGRRWPRPQGL